LRDVLTVLAGILILVLGALLAVPPFVDWPAHRGLVDRAIARAIGDEVRTEGALDIRLLPSPRIAMRRLRIGSPSPDAASLDAISVEAEIALTPLLSGEVRFRDTRIGRVEIKLPTGAGGDWRVPRRLASEANLRRAWAFDALSVQQFLVTTVDPRTGRTDQAYAEDVRIQAGSLAGPWRIDGSVGSAPFELALGELGADLSGQLKLGGGGGALPRFDVDARLELLAGPGDTLLPRLSGTGRLSMTPPTGLAGPPALPVQAQAQLVASGRTVELTNIAIEAGEGSALRLTGAGSYRVDEPRLALTLAGRRFDLAGFWSANRSALAPRLRGWQAPAGMPVDLSLTLDGLAAGGDEDLSGLVLRATAEGDRLRVATLEASGPGGSRLKVSGEMTLGDGATAATSPTGAAARWPSASGQVALTARDSDRLGRYLDLLGVPGAIGLGAGGPLDASADVTLAEPVVSLRNLRVALGDARILGALRYTRAKAGARPRIDAQLAIEGVDVARLPGGGPVFEALRDLDLGLTVDARRVAYGSAGGGRIAGRFSTEGPAILVERLEVADLAGAEANLSGRILPDGSGRLEGRFKAPRAAPLIDLFGRAWIGGLVRLAPDILRDGAVDLAVRAERTEPGGQASALRTSLEGRLAGSAFRATTLSVGGVVTELAASGSTEDETRWLGPRGGQPRRPATLSLSGLRDGAGRLALTLRSDIAGLQVSTSRPFELGGDDDVLERGEVEITSADASGLLPLIGAPATGPAPLSLKAVVSRPGPLRVGLVGRVAGEEVSAELSGSSPGEITGLATLGRLSLPWAASALALNAAQTAPAGSVWPSARFGPRDALPFGGAVKVAARQLDLGAGLSGRDATLLLSTRPDGFRLDELDVALAGGRLRGQLNVGRQGGLASVIGDGTAEGLSLDRFLGAPFGPGRLSATLRFGSSGESVAGLVANLGGSGEVALDGLSVAGADPGAVARVAARVLRSDDPLASARWQALLAEELGRAPLSAVRLSAGASLTGGALRLSPLRADSPDGSWQGSATVDLRTLTLDARGALQSRAAPLRWSGAPPAITLGWSGPLARPTRTVDPGPLVNGLASVVLARELDRIENFELDAAEQGRRNARTEIDRQRRLAAEEAARQARLQAEAEERARQEAERQRREAEERARLDAERQRREAERQRVEAERQRREAERRAFDPDRRLPPIDIRPPAQSGAPGG